MFGPPIHSQDTSRHHQQHFIGEVANRVIDRSQGIDVAPNPGGWCMHTQAHFFTDDHSVGAASA
jgi:hypothetical protein